MNIDQIKELIGILEESKLQKLVLKDEQGCEIHLEKAASPVVHHTLPHHPQTVVLPEANQAHPATHMVQTAKHEEVMGHYITSPMVGTFYLHPAPGDPPFVKIGDVVSEDAVVCIIEAMKVMNEIKAGVKGKIVEICIDNAHAVEFGTKLFRVE